MYRNGELRILVIAMYVSGIAYVAVRFALILDGVFN